MTRRSGDSRTSERFPVSTRPLRLFAGLCIAALFFCNRSVDAESPPVGFKSDVQPFLARYCVGCHGEKKQKGDLRVDTLKPDFGSQQVAGHWMEIMGRINSGDMPPKKSLRPKSEEVARIAEWITAQLTEAEAARQAATGDKVSFQRLSREEYRNTIRDLLGVTYDARDPTGLPEDPDWQGFERIGTVLTLSPAHVEKYMAAAETVLTEALALESQPKRQLVRWTAADVRLSGRLQKEFATKGLLDKVRADVVPDNCFEGHPGSSSEFLVPSTGEYQVRIKLSGLRPAGGRAPRLLVIGVTFDRVLFEQDVEAAEDKPVVLQFRAHLPAGTQRIRIINAVPGPNPQERASRPLNSKPFFSMKSRQPWQIKLTDDDFKPIWPVLLIDWVEWDGPVLQSWPPPARQRIFFAGESAKKDRGYARDILSRFAARAYRRPVSAGEIERLVALAEKAQKLGESFDASVKTALLATLCSKSFLYLIEGAASAPSPRLNDWELASRLSYFLWSTMPDERLMECARQGSLHRPETLRTEVRRMMCDPKALAFADSFPRQWLQLRRVGMFAPDRKLYPEYDDYLEKSMVAETTAYFREVLGRNLSLREFLDSNWTMLNERLATHYGVNGVRGEPLQRVALKPEDHRGGLLTQASILGLTSDGTRHRPVHRGKWVLESIFGKPPPPPPANVGDIKPTPPNQPKATLRAKLEAHRNDANCAACHRKIDPLGLAFDNYDAIGRWRTEEAVRDGAGADPKLDPSGELPDGRKFAGPAELKKLLAADVDKFAAAFIEKAATYALRRGMTFADRKGLAEIAAQAKARDYALADLIETLVLNDLFQQR